MKVTQTLLGWLNRVFDRNPKSYPAFLFNHAGGVAWTVADEVMTVSFPTAPSHNVSIDLTQYTIGALVTYLSGLPGVTVTGPIDRSVYSFGAVALIDGSGDQTVWLTGYTSLLWVWMDAVAEQLHALYLQVKNAPNEMCTTTADGLWLDFIGNYFNVPRQLGELDAAYGPRIVNETIRPLSNNTAIQIILTALTGYACTVVDVISYGAVEPAFDSTYNFNGATTYSASPTTIYGLFDVIFTGTGLGSGGRAALQATTVAEVALIRAAGTHLRNVTISS